MIILNNIADLQKYVVVSQNLTYQSIYPAIFKAEHSYLKPILGDDLYNYFGSSFPDQDLEALLMNAIANLAMWLYITPGGAQIDDKGIYLLKGPDMWRLSDSETLALKKSYSSDAMDAIELLLSQLEANATAPINGQDSNAYQLWYVSPTRSRRQSLLLNTPEQFNDYINLHRNNATFSTLVEPLWHVQRHHIAPMLGDYYATLLAADNLTENDLLLLALVRETMANLAAAKAIRLGCHIVQNTRLTYTLMPDREVNKITLAEYETDGQNALQRLRTELERIKPTGYVPLPSSNTAALRNPERKMFLA